MSCWPISDQARSVIQYARAAHPPSGSRGETPPVAFFPQAQPPNSHAAQHHSTGKGTHAVTDHSTNSTITPRRLDGEQVELYGQDTCPATARSVVIPLWEVAGSWRWRQVVRELAQMAQRLQTVAGYMPDSDTMADTLTAARRIRDLADELAAR